MRNFATVVLISVLLALCFNVAFAGNEPVNNTTMSVNMTNATTETAMPLNCSDLRNCVESCAQIQNCSMYLNCIENCTLNASAAFGEAKGAIPIIFPKTKKLAENNTTSSENDTKMVIPITFPRR